MYDVDILARIFVMVEVVEIYAAWIFRGCSVWINKKEYDWYIKIYYFCFVLFE